MGNEDLATIIKWYLLSMCDAKDGKLIGWVDVAWVGIVVRIFCINI